MILHPWFNHSLRLIPLGGYVAFPDDVSSMEREEEEEVGARRKKNKSRNDGSPEAEGRIEPVYAPDDPDLLQVGHSC